VNRRSFIRGLLASAAAVPIAGTVADLTVYGRSPAMLPQYLDDMSEMLCQANEIIDDMPFLCDVGWDCRYISRIRQIDGELVVDTVPLEETWVEAV